MFRERIKAAYNELSPSFQRVAKYLVDRPYEAAFMTATQLGRELEVDTATVVRFAQRLDYPGFPELLHEVQDEVKGRLIDYFQPTTPAGDELDAFRDAIKQDKTNIEQFELTVMPSTIRQITSMIKSAERILVTGEELGRPLADLLATELRWLRFNASCLSTEASIVSVELRVTRPTDLVIAIASIQHCPDVTSVIEVARARGAQTISLVGGQSWPIALASHVSLLCPSVSKGIRSTASISAAIDAIAQALFFERRDMLVGEIVGFEETMRELMDVRARVNIEPLVDMNEAEAQTPENG